MERINSSLAENIITLLAHSDTHGQLIANLLDTNLMEGDYRVIAEKCVDYWRKYHEAPKSHTADLLSDIIEDPHNRRAATYRSILTNMLRLSESINSQYALDELATFTRMQRIKGAIIQSADRIKAQQEMALPEIESIWSDLLRASTQVGFNPGMRLSNYERMLDYLARSTSEFRTGIPILDHNNVVPARGTVTLILGATGRGKSWSLVHLGKIALLDRFKVAHITLELSEEETVQRYYQSLFAIPKRIAGAITTVKFIKDEKGGFAGVTPYEVDEVDWSLDSPDVAEELRVRVEHMGTLLDNLIIKKFPMRSLTVQGIRGYLDGLEVTEHFVPDLLILDYVGVMKTDDKNHRISLGRTFEDFIGLCEDRKLAGITAHQVGRIGASALSVNMTHISEDWSLTNSAHQVLTLSITDAEFSQGLARLYVGKARSEEDKFGVLLTQSYKIGQFVIDSMLLKSAYFDSIKEKGKDKSSDQDDD